MTATTAAAPVTEPEDDETEAKDLETILPPPGEVEIDGVKCTVRRLKAREFFMVMGVLTNGLGPNLAEVRWEGDSEEIQGMLMGAFLLAIPNAADDVIRLCQHLVEPQGDKKENQRIRLYMENPEVEDLLPVIDALIENEADSIRSLVGKAQAYLTRWRATINRVTG